MRILNGKIKLDKRDVRVGNFVYTLEPEHIKVQDINLTITHRIHRRIAKGQLLELMLEDPEKYRHDLQNYAALMYNLLCTVPDATFYVDMDKIVLDCVNRHKDMYGIKADIGKAEDDAIVQEEKELHEAVEEMKAAVEDESAAAPEADTSEPAPAE